MRAVTRGYIKSGNAPVTRASIDVHPFLQLTLVTGKERRVQNEKLLAKLLNERMAFTWPELVTLLRRLGYTQLEGAGSRVKFDIGDPTAMITLHKPHPGNELKHYIRRQIIEQLKSGDLIQ